MDRAATRRHVTRSCSPAIDAVPPWRLSCVLFLQFVRAYPLKSQHLTRRRTDGCATCATYSNKWGHRPRNKKTLLLGNSHPMSHTACAHARALRTTIELRSLDPGPDLYVNRDRERSDMRKTTRRKVFLVLKVWVWKTTHRGLPVENAFLRPEYEYSLLLCTFDLENYSFVPGGGGNGGVMIGRWKTGCAGGAGAGMGTGTVPIVGPCSPKRPVT